jgi:hypothetical protein
MLLTDPELDHTMLRAKRMAGIQPHTLEEALNKLNTVGVVAYATIQARRTFIPDAFLRPFTTHLQKIRSDMEGERDVSVINKASMEITTALQSLYDVITKQEKIIGERAKSPIDEEAVKVAIKEGIEKCASYNAHDKGFEHGICIGRDGKVVKEADGDKHSVEVKDISDTIYTYAFIHNHPDTSTVDEYTFSDADLRFANAHCLKEVYAVTSKNIYKMTLTRLYNDKDMQHMVLMAGNAGAKVADPTGNPYKFQRAAVEAITKLTGWKYEIQKRE